MREIAPETRKLLDELDAPTIHTEEELHEVLQHVAKLVLEGGQQVARLRGLLQAAELAESDPQVRGKFEAVAQKINAQERIIGKLSQEARALRNTRENTERMVDELRSVVAQRGAGGVS